jgi:hypothetical protein
MKYRLNDLRVLVKDGCENARRYRKLLEMCFEGPEGLTLAYVCEVRKQDDVTYITIILCDKPHFINGFRGVLTLEITRVNVRNRYKVFTEFPPLPAGNTALKDSKKIVHVDF